MLPNPIPFSLVCAEASAAVLVSSAVLPAMPADMLAVDHDIWVLAMVVAVRFWDL